MLGRKKNREDIRNGSQLRFFKKGGGAERGRAPRRHLAEPEEAPHRVHQPAAAPGGPPPPGGRVLLLPGDGPGEVPVEPGDADRGEGGAGQEEEEGPGQDRVTELAGSTKRLC